MSLHSLLAQADASSSLLEASQILSLHHPLLEKTMNERPTWFGIKLKMSHFKQQLSWQDLDFISEISSKCSVLFHKIFQYALILKCFAYNTLTKNDILKCYVYLVVLHNLWHNSIMLLYIYQFYNRAVKLQYIFLFKH